eukprot:NODE_12675_length_257_cov_0.995050.p1 GENE.NODE_12675_length_257_cov_0.995050~~NODE_12675_length_257_cov_0.995050.p1  ORF type:complete len:66 (+),score=14.22 NODE_12675_length_257_cov_0.995050:2-199(+)
MKHLAKLNKTLSRTVVELPIRTEIPALLNTLDKCSCEHKRLLIWATKFGAQSSTMEKPAKKQRKA